MSKSFNLIEWEFEAADVPVQIEEVDPFDARGLRRVYGRGDHFGRHAVFNMDIWGFRNEGLLMRCWSRSQNIDERSFQITGMDFNDIQALSDRWVPKTVRDKYENWIRDEF